MKVSAVEESGFFRSGIGAPKTHFTVMKTSLFFSGDGFSVYDCRGSLVFRVDSYGPDSRLSNELVLMDPLGHCLFTLRRKRPSLHQRWEGYQGERINGQKPIFTMRRSAMIGRSSVRVQVYSDEGEEYQIEGRFGERCCRIMKGGREMVKEMVGEIRRKVDCSTNVLLGKEVFSLSLISGFDAAFAMAIVLVLDQIDGHGGVDGGVNSITTID